METASKTETVFLFQYFWEMDRDRAHNKYGLREVACINTCS